MKLNKSIQNLKETINEYDNNTFNKITPIKNDNDKINIKIDIIEDSIHKMSNY